MASPARAASTTASAVSRLPARATGPADVRLDTARIAAAANGGAGRAVDGRVAELARAPVAELQTPPDDDRAADAGAEREEGGRVAAARRSQSRLGEAERPRVVDQRRRHAECRLHRVAHRHAVPRLRAEVRDEPTHAGVEVEHAGDGHARRVDAAGLGRERAAELAQLLDDRLRRLVRARGDLRRRHPAMLAVEHDSLDGRAAEIEAEVQAHRAIQAPSTVSTAPVTNAAVAR